MKVLVTGAGGFIAKNLIVRLRELKQFDVLPFFRHTPENELAKLVSDVDAVVHLAGVNRPTAPAEFAIGNAGLTIKLCRVLANCTRQIPVIFASSTQAELHNPYGSSKREAEDALREYAATTGASVYIYRLPNVFGKWCKPNYNSVVATFCYNIAHNYPITVNDGNATLTLAYIDDVVDDFSRVLRDRPRVGPKELSPVPVEYKTTVGELARRIESFRDSRISLISERVGVGLARALYATYISYLPPALFAYEVPKHSDPRGVFVEILKTKDSGQFSFFTAHPAVTRGGHYHHTKTEKFLVLTGKARFRFRHIISDDIHELFTSGERPQIVESIPGWSHDITNVGEGEMVVMLWASEIYDRARPDTVVSKV